MPELKFGPTYVEPTYVGRNFSSAVSVPPCQSLMHVTRDQIGGMFTFSIDTGVSSA